MYYYNNLLINSVYHNIDYSDNIAVAEDGMFVAGTLNDWSAEAMIDKARLVYEGEYAILDRGDDDIKYYVRQNNKWLIRRKVGKVSGAVEGANKQSSSSYIENKRNLAIGKGSYSKNTNKISFSGVNHNDVNRAKRRARSSGYVAPPKKSLNVYK